MATERKFYRTVIHVEVLSEEPYDQEGRKTLEDVHWDITEGDVNGNIKTPVQNEEISPQMAAVLLVESGSDPGFFNLTEEGEDAES